MVRKSAEFFKAAGNLTEPGSENASWLLSASRLSFYSSTLATDFLHESSHTSRLNHRDRLAIMEQRIVNRFIYLTHFSDGCHFCCSLFASTFDDHLFEGVVQREEKLDLILVSFLRTNRSVTESLNRSSDAMDGFFSFGRNDYPRGTKRVIVVSRSAR